MRYPASEPLRVPTRRWRIEVTRLGKSTFYQFQRYREVIVRRITSLWTGLRAQLRHHRVQLRLSFRVTVAALVSLALAQFLHLSLPLWAVLTAVIVTQMSVGRSLKATIDYLVGTLGGAIYGGAIAVSCSAFERNRTSCGSRPCGSPACPHRGDKPKPLRRADHRHHRAVGSRDHPRESDRFGT